MPTRKYGDANGELGQNHSLRSRLNMFRAEIAAASGDRIRQMAYLDKAIIDDRSNADALIALYHLPHQDPGRHENTVRMIEEIIDFHKKEIEDISKEIGEPGEAVGDHNAIAWLIANTEGDLDEAIRYPCNRLSSITLVDISTP